MVAAAVISGVAAVGGAAVASSGARRAANTQAASGQQAIDTEQRMFDTVRGDLMPYQTLGREGVNQLTGQLPSLNTQFAPTQEWLENTPGYKFNLSQGLRAVQNSASARGLGISGAAQKGAANFATGLADSTWQTQFNADQAQKTNIYNRLMGVVQAGQNAAAQTGNYGTQVAQSIGQTQQGIGNAQAAGTIGAANATSNALTGIGQSAALLGLYGNGSPAANTNSGGNYGTVTWRGIG